ncbi:xanthine dehydrogenase small subunit [Vibrio sp. CAIM 722]|uniref:Xanthine dehydrogenase small subunit n=1 Tax=Vibrio eleionomae TaxID=2653505 RepID=A0A7X4LKN0_9VIBR|nr:xanthine dehydrogenase small subunit [Vibrio eleionomae]MZI93387.1 xanthine dehydrogenase small subunit [Vibrio eleionomae]
MLEIMINHEVVAVPSTSADTMLLPYLREQCHLTGSKEGCASGDCGACTVVIETLDTDNHLTYQQINSCITPLNALHGKHIITIEYLSHLGALHPIQQRVVDKHGSQCGFCTPGVVMSLYALSKQEHMPNDPTEYLAGNLCRCTGYGPLIDVVQSLKDDPVTDPLAQYEESVMHWLQHVKESETPDYYRPKTREQLRTIKRQYPTAKLIAGGTDLALEVTQMWQTLPELIDLSDVDDLSRITQTAAGWRIGASVPLSKVHQWIKRYVPNADELFSRIGSLSIRHRATLGGSLGHASPIGDIAPLIMSLNGMIEIDDGEQRRLIAPEDFITGYRTTVLTAKQWISAIHLTPPQENEKHAIYKISKRYEDDISTVLLALKVRFNAQGIIAECYIAAGGIAATSVRLTDIETFWIGKPLSAELIKQTQHHVSHIIQPLSDVRASADYRITLVKNLLQRFYLESQHIPTRLVHHA